MNKVVYNADFGGFSISKKCAERMAELGNQEAKELLKEESVGRFYGYIYDTPRHDPTLVQAVEELGASANGRNANLQVYSLVNGTKYLIREYDGSESVIEPEDLNWISTKKIDF